MRDSVSRASRISFRQGQVQQIVFSGSYTDTGAEVEAMAVIGKQRIKYDAALRFLTAA